MTFKKAEDLSPFLTIIFVLLLTTIGHLATDVYLPSLPAMTRYFNVTNTIAQLSIFVYLFSYSLTPLIFGPLSDRKGRRNIILIGLFASIFATLFCILAKHIYWLIFARLLQGVALGAVATSARAMIADKFHGPIFAKYSAYLAILMPVVFALAPWLGGYLQEAFFWQANFLIMLFYIVFLLIFSWYKLAETHPHPSTQAEGSPYKYLLSNRLFRLRMPISGLTLFGISAYLTVSPYLFQDYLGLTPYQYGLIAIAVSSAVLVASLFNAFLINRGANPQTLLHVSGFIKIISGIVVVCIHFTGTMNSLWYIVGNMCFFASIAFSFPNAYSIGFACIKKFFGTAGALIASAQIMTGALSSCLFSFLPETNFLLLGITYSTVGVVMSLLIHISR